MKLILTALRSPIAIALVLCLVSFGSSFGQQPPGQELTEAEKETQRIVPETEAFRSATDQLREHLKAMRKVIVLFNVSESGPEEDGLEQQWLDMVAKGHELHHKMVDAALQEYLSDPAGKADIADMLARLVERSVEEDRYENLLDVGLALYEADYPKADLPRQIAMLALASNEYDIAERFLGMLAADEQFGDQFKPMYEKLPEMKASWERELELREKDANGERLPVVRMRTTKGDIEIELFENQAPGTVANFIDLVERGFYEQLQFHRVVRHFAAQGGCPLGDGTGDDGYTIYGEADKPDARHFFRGSIGMALSPGGKDTGGTQFFLTFLPATGLNGEFTVFGRVIKGMDILGDLTKIDPDAKEEEEEKGPPLPPDEILSAEVVYKRDHEYKPNKVK